MKTKIKDSEIIATCIYSGGGQVTEAAICGQGIRSFCLKNCVFDTNPQENVDALRKVLVEQKAKALIIDNCFTPDGYTAISAGLLAFAAEAKEMGVETFCLCRPRAERYIGCELWRLHKPLKFEDMKDPVLHVARIGSFDARVFCMTTGKVIDDLRKAYVAERDRYAFKERDWPAIIACVRKELDQ